MPDHLAPGGEAIMGGSRRMGTMTRKSASTGQMGRMSIPGYTGHVRGRYAENVAGATHADAGMLSESACWKRGTARSDADSERTRQWKSFDVLSRTIDTGSMNAGIGTSNLHGLTQSYDEHGPSAKTASMFFNPDGHTRFRSGAAIPGYVGHIPGKYAGNVFASTFAQSNMAASGVRRREGADASGSDTNWILACEFDKAAKNHGATADLRKEIRSIGFTEGTRDGFAYHSFAGSGSLTGPLKQTRLPKALRHEEHIDPRVWRLYEPPATHQKLRCYGH